MSEQDERSQVEWPRRDRADRRRFLKQAAALGAAAYVAPEVASAQVEAEMSPMLLDELRVAFDGIAAISERTEGIVAGYTEDEQGFDQEHLEALGELASGAQQVRGAVQEALDLLQDFDDLPPIAGGVDLALKVKRANEGVKKINQGLDKIEEVIPQIPTGGVTNQLADDVKELADDVGEVADGMDAVVPLSGTPVRVAELGLRTVEGAIRILTLPCD